MARVARVFSVLFFCVCAIISDMSVSGGEFLCYLDYYFFLL